MKGKRPNGPARRHSWLLERLEERPDLEIRLQAAGGLATFAHYGSAAWRRSRVANKVDLLELFCAQGFGPKVVLGDSFVDLHFRLHQEADDEGAFPWWVLASRALWAILEEAMRRTLLPLGPPPEGFSPRTLEDILIDPLSRMGGLRTLLDTCSSEHHCSSIEDKLRVLHWTAESGLSASGLLARAMRGLDVYARKTGENPAHTAGFGAGTLVHAILRPALP